MFVAACTSDGDRAGSDGRLLHSLALPLSYSRKRRKIVLAMVVRSLRKLLGAELIYVIISWHSSR